MPLKIKFFLWLVSRGSILTRDVLKARLGKDNGTCLFCARQESIDHLLFSCSLARYIWRVIQCSMGLQTIPSSVQDLFDHWLLRYRCKERRSLLVGIAAVL